MNLCVVPHVSDSHSNSRLLHFGDENKWNASRMAVHGALAAINPQEEDWSEYCERLTFYFTTNGITTDAKKRAVLLDCCGPATFRLLRSLLFTGKTQRFQFWRIGDKNETLFPVLGCNSKPLQTTMLVEGHTLTMEIDTGAAVSIVSEDTVNSSPFLKFLPLQRTDVNLRTYTAC